MKSREMLGWETYRGSFQSAWSGEDHHLACLWLCQSAGDQSSACDARLEMISGLLPERGIVCSCVFATQSADVLGASEAMRGHHPESCPRRALQQGELWVDTSRASGQRVRRVVQGLRAVKMGVAPLVLIFEMLKKCNK